MKDVLTNPYTIRLNITSLSKTLDKNILNLLIETYHDIKYTHIYLYQLHIQK